MRITASGYYRDHGSKVLAEEELAEIAVDNERYGCPYDGMIIQNKDDGLGECYLSIITRINATMQGNYRLEIRFTLSDILKMFWVCFKDKALQVAFESKAA